MHTDSLIAQARRMEEEGNWQRAIETYRVASGRLPANNPLRRELELIVANLTHLEQTEGQVGNVLRQADEFAKQGRWQEAAKGYQWAINLAPKSPTIDEWKLRVKQFQEEADLAKLFEQGARAVRSQEWNAARELLTELLRRRPGYVRNGVSAQTLLNQAYLGREKSVGVAPWLWGMAGGTVITLGVVMLLLIVVGYIFVRSNSAINSRVLREQTNVVEATEPIPSEVPVTVSSPTLTVRSTMAPVLKPTSIPTARVVPTVVPTGVPTATPTAPIFVSATSTPIPIPTPTPFPSATACPGAPIIAWFTASPTSIAAGSATTLSWSVSNANSVSIDGGIGTVAASGSRSVSPGSTSTFTLTALGCGGSNSSQVQVVVSALPPSIAYFNTSSSQIIAGSSAMLSWSVSNATTVSIDNGIGSVSLSGNRSVNPANTTTYTLFASGSGGNTSRQVQVVVIPCPVPSISYFSASPSSITAGSSTTLSWSVSNATTVVIDGFGSVASTGSRSMTLSGNATIFLNAYGCGGNVNRQVQVFIITPTVCPAPSISYFTASPNLITAGSSTTLNWSVSNANSVSIDGGIGTVATLGSRSVSPGGTTTFTLTASGCGGNQTRQTMVTVAPRTNDITGFSVTEISTREIQVSVNYSYNGDHGTNNIFIEAWPQDYRGIDATGVGYTPGGPISIGTGSTVNRVILSGPMPSFSTTQMKMCMYVGGSKEFFCRTFQYSKTWSW